MMQIVHATLLLTTVNVLVYLLSISDVLCDGIGVTEVAIFWQISITSGRLY